MLSEAAIQGLVVALVPPFLVHEELARGLLVCVIRQAVSSARGYFLIYPERKAGSAAQRAKSLRPLNEIRGGGPRIGPSGDCRHWGARFMMFESISAPALPRPSFFRHLPMVACLALWVGLGQAAPVTNQGTWWGTDGTDGTLRARDADGHAISLADPNAAFFYDTSLGITWMADMNLNVAGPTRGGMTWYQANAWAAALPYLGLTWRLPTVVDSGTPGCNLSFSGGTDCGYNSLTQVGGAYSEWAHLFYVTLGNLAKNDETGNPRSGVAGVDWGLVNTAFFQHMPAGGGYWYADEDASYPGGSDAWCFSDSDGWQFVPPKGFSLYAVAVHTGDVLVQRPAPEPQSLLLVMAGMIGLGAAQRRRSRR